MFRGDVKTQKKNKNNAGSITKILTLLYPALISKNQKIKLRNFIKIEEKI